MREKILKAIKIIKLSEMHYRLKWKGHHRKKGKVYVCLVLEYLNITLEGDERTYIDGETIIIF